MILKCIAIDDEPLALDIIEDYASKIEVIDLVAKCTSALEAIKIISKEKIDIVFLDIQMPELNGFEFLESINRKPNIIFTTAYENYAYDSYKFDAIDYLLKPFSLSRFIRAIEKVIERCNPIAIIDNLTPSNGKKEYIFVNCSGVLKKLYLSEIDYIQGYSDYIIIKIKEKNLLVRDQLKNIEELFAGSDFIRIHKSYIVPINRISEISGNNVILGNETIPIGNFYRKSFLSEIEKIKIG
jgi:two-component system, LytTR family, response regulator